MARKTASTKDIRRLTDEDIILEIRDQRRRLFELRSQAVTEKIQDTTQFGKIRRTIARLRTEQTARTKKSVRSES